MALVSSQSLKKEATPEMSDKVAKEDIVRENEAGQQVVVVPKGQPIPDDLDAAIDASIPVRQAAEEAPVEEKKPAAKTAAKRSAKK